MNDISALILAAGKGTRMHSDEPKVLQTLLLQPMLGYVLDALHVPFNDDIWILIGHGADKVRKIFPKHSKWIEQREQLGTAHALMVALPVIKQAGFKKILIVNGDMPLLDSSTLDAIIKGSADFDFTATSIKLENPASYGRIIRSGDLFCGIIEAKDYDDAIYGKPTGEVNAGVYVIDIDMAERLLPLIKNDNVQKEFYLTDLAKLAIDNGYKATAVCLGNNPALFGINTPYELAESEEFLRTSIVRKFLDSGVIIHNYTQVIIGPHVIIEPGAELFGPCQIFGNSKISSGAVIHPFTHILDADICSRALIGPYARLRPGAVVKEQAHVGNFVEMKKAELGCGAKANHLTYLGDAKIGANSNIGAGTITCNYDGVNKHMTIIGEHAFIGSNTALVAPVSVGADAIIGAGSVITKDVSDNTLAVARGRQVSLPKRNKS